MPSKGNANPITRMQNFANVGIVVVVCVLQSPHIRNTRVVDLTLVFQNARARTIDQSIKSIGKDCRLIGHAIVIGINEQTNTIILFHEE